MPEQIKTVIPELSGTNPCCPRCGNAYTPVEYYTGRIVSASRARISYSTVQTQTAYTNIARHVGGLCRYCDKERQKKTARLWAAAGAVGLVMCLTGVLMTVGVIPYDTFKYGGLEVMLIAVGGLALLSGALMVVCTAAVNPAANQNAITLYTRFISRLQKEKGMASGLAYLSSDAARKLQRGQ